MSKKEIIAAIKNVATPSTTATSTTSTATATAAAPTAAAASSSLPGMTVPPTKVAAPSEEEQLEIAVELIVTEVLDRLKAEGGILEEFSNRLKSVEEDLENTKATAEEAKNGADFSKKAVTNITGKLKQFQEKHVKSFWQEATGGAAYTSAGEPLYVEGWLFTRKATGEVTIQTDEECIKYALEKLNKNEWAMQDGSAWVDPVTGKFYKDTTPEELSNLKKAGLI